MWKDKQDEERETGRGRINKTKKEKQDVDREAGRNTTDCCFSDPKKGENCVTAQRIWKGKADRWI